jgi:hypothetical protein
LKHRGAEEVRVVPCPPELTAILWQHLDEHGTAPDGRIFRGARGGPLSESTYSARWAAGHTRTGRETAPDRVSAGQGPFVLGSGG